MSEQRQADLPFIQLVIFQNNDSPREVGEGVNRSAIALDIRISSRSILSLCCEIVLEIQQPRPSDPFAWRCAVLPHNANQPKWILDNMTHNPFQVSLLLLSTKQMSCLTAENARFLSDKTLQTSLEEGILYPSWWLDVVQTKLRPNCVKW